jgi:hypothetical protein
MSQQIPRTAYFAQSGVLTISPNIAIGAFPSGITTGFNFLLPVSSASLEVSRPVEAITSFGQFNSVNNVQTNLTTCKSTLKSYLGSGNGGMYGVTADLLNAIILSNLTGLGVGIVVNPAGYSLSGIVDYIGIDIAMGGLGTCDLGFAGIGYPYSLSAPATTALTVQQLQNTGFFIAPVTTMSVNSFSTQLTGYIASGTAYPQTLIVTGTYTNALSGLYANSIKFSLSMPTDVLSALGDNPNAVQGSLVSQMASKPPYKATIAVEGHGVNITPAGIDTIANAMFGIGNIGIVLPNGKVTARSFNNAAGQISATYSATIEDVSAVFYDLSLASYPLATGINFTGNISSFGPTYGG